MSDNKSEFDREYWDSRWRAGQTGWDMGRVSPPLRSYIDQLETYDLRILVPGAGSGYEVEYLWEKGFRDITVVDISPTALAGLQDRLAGFPSDRLVCQDFFGHAGKYDLILEQTFFSAIHPGLRKDYADHMLELLGVGGKLIGLLWSLPLNEDHPPFGGTEQEYRDLFQGVFSRVDIAPCYNSHPARAGRELFIRLIR